jgi:hypothetical protein
LLAAREGWFLKRLLRDHKLRVYRFSESAAPLGAREFLATREIDALLPLLGDLSPDGSQTRPGPAVRKVLDDLRGSPPAAIVILTDGITTTGDADRLSSASQALVDKLVPVYAVGVGSEKPARDLELYDMLADEVAFVDDPILFSARLKGHGFGDQDVLVTLREDSSSQTLASQLVRVPKDGQPIKIEISYAPPAPGEFDYTLEVAQQPGDANAANNSETRHVSVREEKVRVLLADSIPRYEYRYLKNVLQREKTVQARFVLQDADIEHSADDESVLDHFPVRRDELFEYDVVIFGDLDPGYLTSAVLGHLRDFVRDKGGGMVFVAGAQHNPLAYRGTPLEVMLPIELEGARVPRSDIAITEAFRPQLTLDGVKGSNIFRFGQSERESLEIWRNLPGIYWMIEAPRLKPGAVVFAAHPDRSGAEGRLPVICMQRFGAGKVIFHATDDLWRWRFRVGDLYYGRYWVQAIRYLSRSKLIGKDRAAELVTDRAVYQRGDTVQLRIRFLDERSAPAAKDGVSVMVESRTGTQERVRLSRLPEAPAVFEGSVSRLPDGSYHAWAVAPSFGEAPPATDFRIEAPQRELEKRSLDRADLVQTTKLSHGRYYSLAEADVLPDEIPAGRPVPLKSLDPIPIWNRWELLLLFALLLTAEWILRKRYRLI